MKLKRILASATLIGAACLGTISLTRSATKDSKVANRSVQVSSKTHTRVQGEFIAGVLIPSQGETMEAYNNRLNSLNDRKNPHFSFYTEEGQKKFFTAVSNLANSGNSEVDAQNKKILEKLYTQLSQVAGISTSNKPVNLAQSIKELSSHIYQHHSTDSTSIKSTTQTKGHSQRENIGYRAGKSYDF